jgi:hypothetical protein
MANNMKKKLFLSLSVVVVVLTMVAIPVVVLQTAAVGELTQSPQMTTSTTEVFAPGVSDLLAQGPTPVDVVIETTTHDYAQITLLIQGLGGTVTRTYDNVDALAATLPGSAIRELATSPLVVKIYADTLRYIEGPTDRVTPVEMMTPDNLEMSAIQIDAQEMSAVPASYVNPDLTMADQIWTDPDVWFGAGAKVAIIDTGSWHTNWTDPDGYWHVPWYWGNVYGGIDLSYDVGNPTYEGYDNPNNHYHGTFCAGLLAAHVELVFSIGHPWAEAMLTHYPDGGYYDADGYPHIFVFGIAPAADIYAVKVFDHTGGGVPSSLIMDGIDAAITEGVDVISMSLGGGVGAPGEDPEDLLVDAATAAGITVVAAAGNEGPAPLRVGSPGTAKTSIAVGAAIDPIHHRVAGDIIYGAGYGVYYYPHEEKSIAYFSSRGPTSDGRMKPEVVATGYWTFGGYPPSRWPYTISIGGGTSYSCPQVAGEAALLTAYIKNTGAPLGPTEIKQAIMCGAEPIPGFSEIEQGCGYINCENSLNILKGMEPPCACAQTCTWPHHFGDTWFVPLDLLSLSGGTVTVHDITLNPAQFAYFNFKVGQQVDAVRITLSGVQFAPWEEQNPAFGDSGYIYLSSAIRDGIEDYPLISSFYDYGGDTFIYQFSTDFAMQPGVLRLVFEEDWWSYNSIYIEDLTIEVVDVFATVSGWGFYKFLSINNRGVPVDAAQVSMYDGMIVQASGTVAEGELDIYSFTIPDAAGMGIVELDWNLDWSKWATADLDIIIFKDGFLYSTAGATGSSPESDVISGPGDYEIWVDGYQVYFGKDEPYTLRIIYFADFGAPLWDSDIFALDKWTTGKCLPKGLSGVAVVWIYDTLFGYWYIADYVMV